MVDEHPLLEVLTARGIRADRLTHVRNFPARSGEQTDWPKWADPEVVAGYRALGADRPWAHQTEAADAAWQGRHVALTTSTGSGKSLAFWLPVLSAVRSGDAPQDTADTRIAPNGRRPTAIYLSPTKALAADQLHALRRVLDAASIPDVRVTTCDGDTPREERTWAQNYADIVLTNPDFLHFALLPNHRRWSRLLRGLRYVIVDEGHAYRGVFGAHVSHVLRRLSRLAEYYAAVPEFPTPVARSAGNSTDTGTGRSTPPDGPGGEAHHRDDGRPVAKGRDDHGATFVVASATSAEPGASAARLIGVDVRTVAVVDRDASPSGRRTFALWQPPEVAGYAFHRSDGGSADDDAEPAPGDDDPWALDATPGHESGPATAKPREHPRRSATAEAADLLADLAAAGARTLAFTRSRRGAESIAQRARDHLRHAIGPVDQAVRPSSGPSRSEAVPDDGSRKLAGVSPAERIAAYRGGYLPEERRELERSVRTGEILGLATTNALELGVDISGLDAVLIAGWPGTLTSVWQQAGRAGRAGADGLVAFVAREDPLDTYLVHHPEAIFDAPLETTVFDPANPHVLAPHLCVAAQEVPLRSEDLTRFGDPAHVRHVLDVLVRRGALRRRASGWYWTHRQSAAGLTDLRGAGGSPVRVVEAGSGRLLGTVDASSADGQVHDGAVYVHQGVTYLVDHLDLTDHTAVVVPRDVDYGTWSREVMEVAIVGYDDGRAGAEAPSTRTASATRETVPADDGSAEAGAATDDDRRIVMRRWGPIEWGIGPVEVTSQVVSFQRRRLPDMQTLGTEALDLPERTLGTVAVWWSVPEFVLRAAGVSVDETPGALHAAEHASIGMLPLLATCDRWDLGGVSTELHADTGEATVFVYDAFPGGAGFAERAYELGAVWLRATREAIAGCGCADGCPACVQSPKCGSENSPLEKDAAVRLLDAVLRHAPK